MTTTVDRDQLTRSELIELLDDCETDAELDALVAALDRLENSLTVEGAVVDPQQTRAEKMREASRSAQRKAMLSGQDIGLPFEGDCDPERRRQSDESLLFHLTAYYPETFFREFPPEMIRIIGKIQEIIETGGRKAVALMRKGGKSSVLTRAVIWAVLTGRRRYVCLISASSKTAKKLLGKIKRIIRTNTMIQSDYAASLHCLVSLNGRSNAANGQHVQGRATNVQWSNEFIASGFIEGYHESEWCISSLSILSEDIRGQSHLTVTGQNLRVGCVLVDDPASRATASSKPKVKKRLEIINGDVASCGGEEQPALFAAVTVIAPKDVADVITNREKSKAWLGERIPCVIEWPDESAMTLWSEWEELYNDELDLDDVTHAKSRQFVRDNFEDLHRGHAMFAPEDYDRANEESSLHSAMIKKADDPVAFAAEKQLAPLTDTTNESIWDLDAETIALRVSPAKRFEVPEGCEVLTGFVDVQNDYLWYCVMAWRMDGRGYVIDYSTFPSMDQSYWDKQSLPRTFHDVFGPISRADAISEALKLLTDDIMEREYFCGETPYSIDKLGIDVGYKLFANEVRTFCRESLHRARLHPAQGRYIGAKTQHWQRIKGNKGANRGIDCAFFPAPKAAGRSGNKEIVTDVNAWKSRCAEALTVPATSAKAILLFDDVPENHLMFAEGWETETPHRIRNEKNGDEFIEWRPASTGQIMNESIDGIVACASMASTLGVFKGNKSSGGPDLSGFRARLAGLSK